MNALRIGAVTVIAVAVAACGGQDDSPDAAGTWVGTVTTEGDVTTVINESGSVWGGTAMLFEEASIGVEIGPEEHMLGSVLGVAATDERIYVLDSKPPVVRVYDYDGNHLFDIGREGQGPGELFRVRRLVIDARSRLIVQQQTRFSIFDLDGEFLDTWPASIRSTPTVPLVVTDEGHVYDPRWAERGPRAAARVVPRFEFVNVGREGPIGEPLTTPDYGVFPHLSAVDGSRMRVPFWPVGVWALVPSGAMIAGVPDAYRFAIRGVDGRTTVVERRIEPVVVQEDEAAWHRRAAAAIMRAHQPSWRWNGPEIPSAKPFYSAFAGDDQRRIWVARPGPGIHLDECDEDPPPTMLVQNIRRCWRDESLVEMFDRQGRYLGDVDVPRPFGILRGVVFHGDNMFLQMIDEEGTAMVKRYRLVVPGEE